MVKQASSDNSLAALLIFSAMPKSNENQLDQNKKRCYYELPADKEFTRQNALEVGLAICIKERTVDKYFNRFLG